MNSLAGPLVISHQRSARLSKAGAKQGPPRGGKINEAGLMGWHQKGCSGGGGDKNLRPRWREANADKRRLATTLKALTVEINYTDHRVSCRENLDYVNAR